MLKQPSCGFGKSIAEFYKSVGNTDLTPGVKGCLNLVYGPEDASYSSGYAPDVMRPPWGNNLTSFGKKVKTDNLKQLKKDLRYLLK